MKGSRNLRKYPSEIRERAVRPVAETIVETGERHGAMTKVARQLGIGTQSLRTWVARAEVDPGSRPGLSSQERLRLKPTNGDPPTLALAGTCRPIGSVGLGLGLMAGVWD